ncbi:MAG: DNA gyrase subunit A [Actinomycetota bacterium]
MRATTGLSLLDLAILSACEAEGAQPTAPFRKTMRILQRLFDATSVGPDHAHEPLLDMARPWLTNVPLIEGHGNIGSPDDPPANPRYTECRMTPIGRAALAAERELIGPLPVGLINGSMGSGGVQPPYDVAGVAAAIRAAAGGSAADDDLIELVRPPSFPTGCTVDVDHHALARGDRVELRQRATILHLGDEIMVTALPLRIGLQGVVDRLQRRLRQRDADRSLTETIRDINDNSTFGSVQLLISLRRDADPDPVLSLLDSIWELNQTAMVQLREPLTDTIRRAAGGDDLEHRLSLLDDVSRR